MATTERVGVERSVSISRVFAIGHRLLSIASTMSEISSGPQLHTKATLSCDVFSMTFRRLSSSGPYEAAPSVAL